MNEQKQKFSHFLTLCDDYATAQLAFTTAERAAEAVRAAVAERIQAEKEQTTERLAELERMVKDGSRPASARRIWEQELSRLQGRTFGATPDEAAAFDTEMAAAQEAVEDMRRLQGEIREAISAVNGAITELRAQTLGDPVTGLRENRLDGVRKGFAPLCREVSA